MPCSIIMYHYVRNMAGTPYPAIHGLTIPKFEAQLDYIQKNFTVISLRRYMSYLTGNIRIGPDAELALDAVYTGIPSNACILTFDDGLRDHYSNVFPILKKRGLTATFFPLTEPIVDGTVADVHKAHFLFAKIGTERFAKEYNEFLKALYPKISKHYLVSDDEKLEPKYRWDDNLTANLKYSISRMPELSKREILKVIWKCHFNDEKDFCRELYMSIPEMREMSASGMTFGGHTHTHPSLSHLTIEEQREEIRRSKGILEVVLGYRMEFFSYPYGSFNRATLQVLKEHSYTAAVTTDTGVNKGKADPFKLKRMDTNDLPQETA